MPRFALASSSRRARVRRYAASFIVLALGTAGTAGWNALQTQQTRDLQHAQLQQFAKHTDVELQLNLQPAFYIVNSLEVFIRESSGAFEPLQLESIMRELGLHTDHLLNLTVAPNNRMDFIIPRAGNEAVIGKRYEDLAEQWPAIKAIIDSKQARLVGPMRLVQGGSGLVYRHPVYLNDGSYWGLVSVVLDAEEVLDTASEDDADVVYALREVNAADQPLTPVFWGDAAAFVDPYILRTLSPSGAHWQLALAEPRVDMVAGQTRWGIGLLLSLMLAVLTYITARSVRARRIAGQQLASVFASARDGVAILDPKGHVLDVNAAMVTMFGYERAQARGKRLEDFGNGLTPEAVYASLWAGATQHGFWRGELTNRHADGTISTDIAAVSAVRDKQGVLTHYVVSMSSLDSIREDVVTGLPSRNVLDDRISQALAAAAATNAGVALLVVGLDHFRDVNDSYGHRIGDLLLRAVGQRIRETVGPNASIARVGGDEFAVILTDSKSAIAIEAVVGRLIEVLGAPYAVGEHELRGSGSIGISIYPSDAGTAAEMFQHAGQALRKAKDEGRNRFAYFNPGMQAEVLERSQLAQDLWRALEAGEITSYFQPIVDLRSGRIVKAEALARWHHPDRGLLGPASFVPIAERLGIIGDLGQHLFEGVVDASHRLHRAHPGFQVSFNMSPLELAGKSLGYHDRLQMEIAEGFPPNALVIEITEGVLVERNDIVTSRLRQLREDGVQFAVDDFGTGYSSLSYLQQLDVDFLKIDRSFISGLEPGNDAHALCQAVIEMAHRLKLQVVAEGVETEQQRDLLVEAGCDLAQGFLFARPMPAADLRALLDAQSQS